MNEELSSKLEALLEREQDPFTAQDVLLNVVNKIRFQYFDQALKEFLEGIPAVRTITLIWSCVVFVCCNSLVLRKVRMPIHSRKQWPKSLVN